MKNIAVVGIDGSGKSTLVNALKIKLESSNSRKVKIVRTKKANSGLYSDICEKYSIMPSEDVKAAAFYLDLLAEYNNISEIEADYCIWDRYFYCLEAYFRAENINIMGWVSLIRNLPEPEYIVFCDLDPSDAIKRIKYRGHLKVLETEEYLIEVRREYNRILSDREIIYIDARKDIDYNLDVILSKLEVR